MAQPSSERSLVTPLWLITAGVIVVGLYIGRLFLVPIAFAMLLSTVCRPVVRTLHRQLRVPPTISAAVVILALVGALAGAGFALAGPAQRWWAQAPQTLSTAEDRLRSMSQALRQVTELKDRVDHLGAASTTAPTTGPTSGPTSAPTSGPSAGATTQPKETLAEATTAPSGAPRMTPAGDSAAPASSSMAMISMVFGGLSELLGGLLEVIFLAFLILSSDGLFLRKLRSAIPGEEGKGDAGSVVHEAESLVFRYLLVTLCINLMQATAVGITMKLLGLPHPLLWALLTIVLEFVPYLGATVMIVLLSLAALATFESVGHASVIPGAYLVISLLQNNLVSPLLYGNHLKLNAVAILIGVIFFWFVWGIPGAFIAVPVMAILRVATEKSDRWRPIGSFLAD